LNEKIPIAFIITILLLTTGTQALTTKYSKINEFEKLNTSIIFVDKNNTIGPWDGTYNNPYNNIQKGINAAEKGNIVFIVNGKYTEQIEINKSIHLLGENKEKTIINVNYTDYGIKLNTNNIEIEKLTIKNVGGYKENSAIKINGDNNKISDVIIKRAKVGILFNTSDGGIVENSTIYLCGKGIFTKLSRNIEVKNLEICHCGIGIHIENSNTIDISDTQIHETGAAFYTYNSVYINIIKTAIYDNNDNGGGGIILESSNIVLDNCNVMHNGFGIRILESHMIDMKNCDFKNNTHFGVLIMDDSKDITILDSDITTNFRYGIYVIESECEVKNSNLFDNKYQSAYTENSICYAKNNYWGGLLGPRFNKGFRTFDKITKDFRKLKYIPWKMRPIIDIGSDWNIKDRFTKKIVNGYEDEEIKITGTDSDNDSVPDWWEEEFGFNPTSWDDHKNIDIDNDALNNIEEFIAYEWGADPNFKDIFIEFDWMESQTEGAINKPSQELVDEMKERFLEHDIRLHVDLGNFGGSDIVPYNPDVKEDELLDIYWDYFLHNDLNNPKKNIFHYGFICDKGPGVGFTFLAWGHINSWCICADLILEGNPQFTREVVITHASMHELGHTLGLIADDFEGNDNHATTNPKYPEFWKYNGYKSLMNYRWTYSILDFSDGENRNDYDDWENMDLEFFKNTHWEWPKN